MSITFLLSPIGGGGSDVFVMLKPSKSEFYGVYLTGFVSASPYGQNYDVNLIPRKCAVVPTSLKYINYCP